MPKRVIDFDAMWGSDKLASCAEWAQAEYAWLYGLADASGCFELTNLRVIWGRVAAIRRNLTIERLEQIFDEFQDKGLLFVWEHEGKRYGHWTGSDVPGRLPPPSWRMRLERLAPPVPKKMFAEYVSRFARGRAALAGMQKFEISDLKFEMVDPGAQSPDANCKNSDLKLPGSSVGALQHANSPLQAVQNLRLAPEREGYIKGGLEEAQAQDWNWDLKMERKRKVEAPAHRAGGGEPVQVREMIFQTPFSNTNSKAEAPEIEHEQACSRDGANSSVRGIAAGAASSAPVFQSRDKSFLVAGELLVGRGPVCGPGRIRPEVLERIRAREAARKGSRSP